MTETKKESNVFFQSFPKLDWEEFLSSLGKFSKFDRNIYPCLDQNGDELKSWLVAKVQILSRVILLKSPFFFLSLITLTHCKFKDFGKNTCFSIFISVQMCQMF